MHVKTTWRVAATNRSPKMRTRRGRTCRTRSGVIHVGHALIPRPWHSWRRTREASAPRNDFDECFHEDTADAASAYGQPRPGRDEGLIIEAIDATQPLNTVDLAVQQLGSFCHVSSQLLKGAFVDRRTPGPLSPAPAERNSIPASSRARWIFRTVSHVPPT